jgi:hypothetical protein
LGWFIAWQGNSFRIAHTMNKNIGFELIAYGVLLAGLSYLTHHLAPTIARPTLITGLVGGALCLAWGVRAVIGKRGKALPILTLVPISYVLISQAVVSWGGGTEEVPGQRMAALVITVLCVFSVGMLMMIAYTGVTFYGQAPGPTNPELAKPQTPGKPEAQGNATSNVTQRLRKLSIPASAQSGKASSP